MAPNRIPKPDPFKAQAVEKLRKDLEPAVRASFLASAIQNLSEHAAKGGKNESLGKHQFLQLFEVAGALAKDLCTTLEPTLLGKTIKLKEAKLNLRKQVLSGVSPPSITTPLVDSEMFSEDLFPKDRFLEVDAEAMKTDDKNVFPCFKAIRGPKRPMSDSFYPLKKRTKPAQVPAPVIPKTGHRKTYDKSSMVFKAPFHKDGRNFRKPYGHLKNDDPQGRAGSSKSGPSFKAGNKSQNRKQFEPKKSSDQGQRKQHKGFHATRRIKKKEKHAAPRAQ